MCVVCINVECMYRFAMTVNGGLCLNFKVDERRGVGLEYALVYNAHQAHFS